MIEPNKQIFVEFNNQAPDTIEIRPVADTKFDDLTIPDEAIMFWFFSPGPNNIPESKSPYYYLSTEPEFGSAEEMIKKYPDYASMSEIWKKTLTIGKISWDFFADGQQWKGFFLAPLEEIVLLNRRNKEIVWPVANKPLFSPTTLIAENVPQND